MRALAYEASGKKTQAKKELERIYAEDSSFLHVAERLWTRSAVDAPARSDV